MPYPPKSRHIGQTGHTRGSAYATCSVPCTHLQHNDARDEALGQQSTADVLLTKPPIRTSEAFRFTGFAGKKESRRADSNR
jgi:hypothetical protein